MTPGLSFFCHVSVTQSTYRARSPKQSENTMLLRETPARRRSRLTSSILGILLGLGLLAQGAGALELGAEDFDVARAVTCVMVQDALGYLDPQTYDTLLDDMLGPLGEVQGDVVYATAIGYFDGMMFGIAAGDERQIQQRLREFNASGRCSLPVASQRAL
jgi:hypothetical protein